MANVVEKIEQNTSEGLQRGMTLLQYLRSLGATACQHATVIEPAAECSVPEVEARFHFKGAR